MLALEEMREVAAGLYLNEFGSSWKPVSSSRFNHSAMLTSALVEGPRLSASPAEAKRRAAMPEGTPVVFAGGRTRHPTEDDALTFANNVWATLDKVRDRVPDMVLVHGGDTKGVDRLASSGRNDATSRRSASRSTCAWAPVQASSATSGCSRSTRVTSSPFPEMASWSAWSSKPNPVGSPLSIAAVRLALHPKRAAQDTD
jgi:hypothetical protein